MEKGKEIFLFKNRILRSVIIGSLLIVPQILFLILSVIYKYEIYNNGINNLYIPVFLVYTTAALPFLLFCLYFYKFKKTNKVIFYELFFILVFVFLANFCEYISSLYTSDELFVISNNSRNFLIMKAFASLFLSFILAFGGQLLVAYKYLHEEDENKDKEYDGDASLEQKRFIWCLVGNIIEKHYYGEEKQIRTGTKQFSPNTKVYCFPALWGDGYEDIKVIGRPRSSNKYITVIMKSKYIKNWRLQKVYQPYVINKMDEENGWDDSDNSKDSIMAMLKWLPDRTAVIKE
jgi:hypothetical protein